MKRKYQPTHEEKFLAEMAELESQGAMGCPKCQGVGHCKRMTYNFSSDKPAHEAVLVEDEIHPGYRCNFCSGTGLTLKHWVKKPMLITSPYGWTAVVHIIVEVKSE